MISHTGVAKRLATPEEMAEPLVFLNSDMVRFISVAILVVDYAAISMITLGLVKDQMNVPVGLKIFNSSFMQKQLKKQLEGLDE